MKIRATVRNTATSHTAAVATNESKKELGIPRKAAGLGSSVNGGELLFLSLVTCYCNDIFREAEEIGIPVKTVEVSVEGNFGGKGEPATQVNYDVKIADDASEAQIKRLLQHTDTVAEIQNTLRSPTSVKLRHMEIQK